MVKATYFETLMLDYLTKLLKRPQLLKANISGSGQVLSFTF